MSNMSDKKKYQPTMGQLKRAQETKRADLSTLAKDLELSDEESLLAQNISGLSIDSPPKPTQPLHTSTPQSQRFPPVEGEYRKTRSRINPPTQAGIPTYMSENMWQQLAREGVNEKFKPYWNELVKIAEANADHRLRKRIEEVKEENEREVKSLHAELHYQRSLLRLSAEDPFPRLQQLMNNEVPDNWTAYEDLKQVKDMSDQEIDRELEARGYKHFQPQFDLHRPLDPGAHKIDREAQLRDKLRDLRDKTRGCPVLLSGLRPAAPKFLAGPAPVPAQYRDDTIPRKRTNEPRAVTERRLQRELFPAGPVAGTSGGAVGRSGPAQGARQREPSTPAHEAPTPPKQPRIEDAHWLFWRPS